MKRVRVLAGLITAGAIVALAPGASASPVFYTKVEVGATASAPIPFSGSVGSGYLEGAASRTKIECTNGSAHGEVTGPKRVQDANTTFVGCKASGFSCTGVGEIEGTIATKTLEGELGEVSSGVPALRLISEAEGRGGFVAEASCAGGAAFVKVRGSIIGQLSGGAGATVAEGKFASSFHLIFAEKEGIQKYVKFAGESGSEQFESQANEGPYEKDGLSALATLKAPGTSNLGFTK
jgi:hypothetical protein